MSSDVPNTLSPRDLAVTVRSLPRRLSELATAYDDPAGSFTTADRHEFVALVTQIRQAVQIGRKAVATGTFNEASDRAASLDTGTPDDTAAPAIAALRDEATAFADEIEAAQAQLIAPPAEPGAATALASLQKFVTDIAARVRSFEDAVDKAHS